MRAKNPYKYYNVKEAKCIIWYPTAASWLLTKEVSVHHFTLKKRVLCIKALSKHTLYWLALILIACDTKCHFLSEATLLLIWCDLVDGARHGAVIYLSSGIIADYRCHTARMNMNCFAFGPDLQTSHMKAMSVQITGYLGDVKQPSQWPPPHRSDTDVQVTAPTWRAIIAVRQAICRWGEEADNSGPCLSYNKQPQHHLTPEGDLLL